MLAGAKEYADSVWLEIENFNQVDNIVENVDIQSVKTKVMSMLANGTFEKIMDDFLSDIPQHKNYAALTFTSNLGAEVIAHKQFEEDLLKKANKRERIFWILIVILSLLSMLLIYTLICKNNNTLRFERDSI